MNEAEAHAASHAWEQELHTTGAVHFSTSRSRIALLLALSTVLVLVGVFMILDGGFVSIVGWFAVVFFGVLGIPVLIWRLITGRPNITVHDDRVTIGGSVHVPWRDVAGVLTIVPRGGKPVIALRMRDEAAQRSVLAKARVQLLLVRISNSMTKGPDIGIPNDLMVDQPLLMHWLAAVHRRAILRESGPGQPPPPAS